MNVCKRRSIPAVVAAAVGFMGITAFAQETQPNQQELLDTVKALQAKVAQLEANQSSTSTNVETALVDRTVAQIQKDVAERTQLLQVSGLTSGFIKDKFTIQSEDGKFSVSPFAQLQFRGVANYRDEDTSDPEGDDSSESGFEIRRTKFGFNGKFAGDFAYKFVWATNRQGGTVFLEDAEVAWKVSDTISVYGGQFKDPIHHEELVSSTRQLAAERSLVNELLGGGVSDRIQGVGVAYEDGPLYGTVVLSDGINSDNPNFRDSTTNPTDWGVTGRVEYTVFGDKKAAYADFSAFGNKKDLLVIGGGVNGSGLATGNSYLYTVDAQYETTTGLGIYGAALGQTIDGGEDGSENNFGFLLQASQMLSEKWEVFGRGGYISLDDSDSDDVIELTGGVNYYFYKHNAKFTADLTYYPNGSPADTGVGVLDSGEEAQIVARVQFQLAL